MGILLERQLNPVQRSQVEDRVIVKRVPRVRIAMTILVSLLIGIWLNISQFDLAITTIFSDRTAGFPYRLDWLFDIVLHLYAARFSAYIGAILIVFNIIMWIGPKASLKIVLAARYIMFTWLLSVLTIAILKDFTTLPCPWDITQFGGDELYVYINDVFSDAYPMGNCFPSAHATGGYGLLGLGFVSAVLGFSMYRGFCIALVIGFIYGGAQVVRGAHFISHDLFTAAICLAYAWAFAEIYLVRRHGLLK